MSDENADQEPTSYLCDEHVGSDGMDESGVTIEQIAQAAGQSVPQVLANIEVLIDAGYLTPLGDGTFQLTIPEEPDA